MMAGNSHSFRIHTRLKAAIYPFCICLVKCQAEVFLPLFKYMTATSVHPGALKPAFKQELVDHCHLTFLINSLLLRKVPRHSGGDL